MTCSKLNGLLGPCPIHPMSTFGTLKRQGQASAAAPKYVEPQQPGETCTVDPERYPKAGGITHCFLIILSALLSLFGTALRKRSYQTCFAMLLT